MTGPDGALERSLRDGPSDEGGYRPVPLGLLPGSAAEDAIGSVQRARTASVRLAGRPTGASRWQAIAAVLVVGASLVIAGLVASRQRSEIGGPSTRPASRLPALTETFVSTRNGFSLLYPAGWLVTPATTSWREGAFITEASPTFDKVARLGIARILVASQRLAAGLSEQERLVAPRQIASCGGDPSTWPRLSIDGESGYLSGAGCPRPPDNGAISTRDVAFDAMVFSGGRFYTILLDGDVDLADFQALLATIHLEPTQAIDPS